MDSLHGQDEVWFWGKQETSLDSAGLWLLWLWELLLYSSVPKPIVSACLRVLEPGRLPGQRLTASLSLIVETLLPIYTTVATILPISK